MDADKLKKVTSESLAKKLKANKFMIGLLLLLSAVLTFFFVKDYFKSGSFDYAVFTIIICTIGGAASVFPEFKAIKNELKQRNK